VKFCAANFFAKQKNTKTNKHANIMPIAKNADSVAQVCSSVGKQMAVKSYNLRLQAVKKLSWTFDDPDIANEVQTTRPLECSCSFDELSRKTDRLYEQYLSITEFKLKLKRAARDHGKQDDPAYALNVMVKHIEDSFVAVEAFEKTYKDVVQNAVHSLRRESGRPIARQPPVGMTFDDDDSDDDDI
jgi:hypothetical protein